MEALPGLLALCVVGVVAFGLFVILRGFALWYWRVEDAIEMLARQAKAAERTAAAVEELVSLARPGK